LGQESCTLIPLELSVLSWEVAEEVYPTITTSQQRGNHYPHEYTMCRPDTITAATTNAATSPDLTEKGSSRTQLPLRVLMSLELYYFDQQGQRPDVASCALTTGLFVVLLLAIKWSLHYCFEQNKHLHAILENETHCNILARHIGINALASMIVVWAGWSTRHTFAPMMQAVLY